MRNISEELEEVMSFYYADSSPAQQLQNALNFEEELTAKEAFTIALQLERIKVYYPTAFPQYVAKLSNEMMNITTTFLDRL